MKRLSILAAALGFAASAQALTVSYNFTIPLAETDFTQTGTLGLFDSDLGTLTGASLFMFGVAEMSFGGKNTAAQDQTATLTSSVELSWSSTLAALSPLLTATVLLSTTSGSQVFIAGGDFQNFGPLDTYGTANNNLASILGSLQKAGGGGFDVTCKSSSKLDVVGGDGNIATTRTSRAQCGASIQYNYDKPPIQVPEPTSLALVGLALAGLGVRRRNA